MSWISKLVRKIMPEDKATGCGYGPFRLPSDHPFTRGCNLHDFEFDQAHAGKGNKGIAQVDWELFYRWVLIARAEPTYTGKCNLASEICKYWPMAHGFGPYLWDGKDE